MEDEEAAAAPASGDTEDGPLFTPEGKEISSAKPSGGSSESEVSRLNTKVAALETKVDVLSSNLERLQAQKSQPIIQAEPQANLAAPVSDSGEVQDQSRPVQVSAAPSRPNRLPSLPKETSEEIAAPSPKSASAAEKEFRSAMQLFQNGQNLDASSRFALMAKKFPHHMLAAHALYWSGEAAARAQQWSIATESWSELERKYPHSTYMPEALAGLAKAYESQGDAQRAKTYRTLLTRSFPKSSVAMKAGSDPLEAAPARRISRSSVAPAPREAAPADDEAAPVFQEEGGGTPTSSGAGGEPPTETQ
jgi:TolA-binding protein